MSNGKGMVVTALILGLAGLGLGGYVFYDQTLAPLLENNAPEPELEINNYYIEDNSYFFSTTGTQSIDTMSIEFSTTKNASMYASFSCYVKFTANGGIRFYVYLNGVIVGYQMRVTAEVTTEVRIPVNLQHYEDALAPGTYNVSIWCYMGAINMDLYGLSLYVQTIA